ncbi:MAG: SUMF1/EgtB/PvdO family nonheme iron enzyme [Pirellulales bacterium]
MKVEVGPMWVARTETTWRVHHLHEHVRCLLEACGKNKRVVTEANQVDAVTAPTALYEPTFTYEFGQDPDLPAVTMTQYAAKQYTKWLSKLSGHQYRLCRSQWEYACRLVLNQPTTLVMMQDNLATTHGSLTTLKKSLTKWQRRSLTHSDSTICTAT